jgi:hypothetical protein
VRHTPPTKLLHQSVIGNPSQNLRERGGGGGGSVQRLPPHLVATTSGGIIARHPSYFDCCGISPN